jgi:hypothetical protein
MNIADMNTISANHAHPPPPLPPPDASQEEIMATLNDQLNGSLPNNTQPPNGAGGNSANSSPYNSESDNSDDNYASTELADELITDWSQSVKSKKTSLLQRLPVKNYSEALSLF